MRLRVRRTVAVLAFAAMFLPAGASAQNAIWAEMPRMELEAQYAGPLRDTIVQRFRDPVDGTVCFIYLPIIAQHTPPNANGLVAYGANTIGSISCVPGERRDAAPPQEEAAAPQ